MPLHLDGKSKPGPLSIDWQRVALAHEKRIAELEAERASMIDTLTMIARYESGNFIATEAERLQSCCEIARIELDLYGVKP